MNIGRTLAWVLVPVAAVTGSTITGPWPNAAGQASGDRGSFSGRHARVDGDFNGDGYGDLAVGVPGEAVTAQKLDAGAVNIIYGSRRGLRARGNQQLSQDSPGILGTAETGDRFGARTTTGDFNGDGFSDLAVASASENLDEKDPAANAEGAVNVIYGSPGGLTERGNQLWSQATPGIADEPEEMDSFGSSLTAADFNGDGLDDLAVGVPWETLHPTELDERGFQGAAHVIFGSRAGLTSIGSQFWTQDSPGMPGVAGTWDFFGSALAAADLGRSRHADLVISATWDGLFTDEGDGQRGGVVHVLYGSSSGPQASRSQLLSRDTPGVDGEAWANDFFGAPLAVADFGRGRRADLVTRSNDQTDELTDPAVVHAFYGLVDGLATRGSQRWNQASPGILDSPEFFDGFGFALAGADFGRDRHADLAITVLGEEVGDTPASDEPGAVQIIYGTDQGLSAAGNQLWTQDSPGIADAVEADEGFGRALAAVNFGGSRHADLAVGSFETVGPGGAEGAVNVIYGTRRGLSATSNQFWTLNSPGIVGHGDGGEHFGESLAPRQ